MQKYIKILLLCFIFINNPIPVSSSRTKEVIITYDDILNEPVKNIDPNKPMIALTFDDGPYREYTTMILDTLKQNNSYATFFVLGTRIEKAPDLLERMILEGHEIGNHTYSHIQLTTLSEVAIKEEIDKANQEIYKVIHRYPHVLRPPYGDYNESVMNHLGEMKMVKWNVDSEDWRSKNANAVVQHVLKEVRDKSIILLHDQYLSTALAIEILVPALLKQGYQFVTVSDLYSFE